MKLNNSGFSVACYSVFKASQINPIAVIFVQHKLQLSKLKGIISHDYNFKSAYLFMEMWQLITIFPDLTSSERKKRNLLSASSLNHVSKEIGLVLTQFSKNIWFIVLFRKNMCEIGQFLSQTTCLPSSKSYFGHFLRKSFSVRFGNGSVCFFLAL